MISKGVTHTAVLLIQLGTPEEPTPSALRRFLRQFLSDPRVIETPTTWAWLRWQLILRLFILTTRPARSAAKYRAHLGSADRFSSAAPHLPPNPGP